MNVLIRNLDKDLVKKLKERAERNGRSLQAELRMILETRVQVDESLRRAAEVRKSFGDKMFTDTAELIRKMREER